MVTRVEVMLSVSSHRFRCDSSFVVLEARNTKYIMEIVGTKVNFRVHVPSLIRQVALQC